MDYLFFYLYLHRKLKLKYMSQSTKQIAKAIRVAYYPADAEVEVFAQKRNNQYFRFCQEWKPSVEFMSKRRFDIFKQSSDLVYTDCHDASISDYLKNLNDFNEKPFAVCPCYTLSTLKGNRITTMHVICVAQYVNNEVFTEFYWFKNVVDTDKAAEIFTVDFDKFVETPINWVNNSCFAKILK